jgi:hypothetical protein
MASTVKHLRSSTANKRPTASGLADGQLGINTASGTPGVFFKDSAGTVTKVGPAHVGSTAPNVSPAGSAGNSLGELWVNNSTTINGLNYYTGSAFVNLTPSGTTTVAGLVELATNAETQTGTDTVRAVTPSGLQSKISNSTSTTSSTTIASSTAVKAAYDLADAALPKSGGRVTGALEIGPAGSLVFEGSSDDSFETTIAVVNPTAARTITFPDVTGTVITAGDTGTVTSTMILDDTIVNDDINASAAIALSKLATGALPTGITIASGNIVDGTITNADINASAGIVYNKLALSSGIVNADINASAAIALSKLATGALPTGITVSSGNIVDGTIVNADINASAAIAGTKISPDFGSQNIVTLGRAGIGASTSSTIGLRILQDAAGADLTVVSANWTATTGTIANLANFSASRSATGATITNLFGFNATSILTSATNNYGFYSDLASATGRHNFYANGTAPNYFAGDLRTNTVVTSRHAPANSNISATATASSLLDGLRTGTPTGNITLTLPTGTDMDSAFQDLQANQSFEWSVINLAAATHLITVTAAATGHTVVGNMAVAANGSGRFITRKTAADTFISYRIG